MTALWVSLTFHSYTILSQVAFLCIRITFILCFLTIAVIWQTSTRHSHQRFSGILTDALDHTQIAERELAATKSRQDSTCIKDALRKRTDMSGIATSEICITLIVLYVRASITPFCSSRVQKFTSHLYPSIYGTWGRVMLLYNYRNRVETDDVHSI